MTTFNIDSFTFDGMYLMYTGDYDGAVRYAATENGRDVHPSRVGTLKSAFIARFKYGRKPWKTYCKFIAKNFTVEEYLAASEATSPLEAMRSKGFTR